MKLPPQNIEKKNLVKFLRKKSKENNAKIWLSVAKLLEKAKRRRTSINLSKINRYTERDDVVVVPGKTLSSGLLDHPVTVAAYAFSRKAKEKIEGAGGKCLTIKELVESNPKGSHVKIIA
ncbi:MAG: 50S ribosomal protein L18e [Candidatus Bathyarchaeota archaeon]|nr:50S ribosomal protein L18e [Candidatus Bathyarchaeota archaeon]